MNKGKKRGKNGHYITYHVILKKFQKDKYDVKCERALVDLTPLRFYPFSVLDLNFLFFFSFPFFVRVHRCRRSTIQMVWSGLWNTENWPIFLNIRQPGRMTSSSLYSVCKSCIIHKSVDMKSSGEMNKQKIERDQENLETPHL